MKQLVCEKPYEMTYKQGDIPKITEDEVLIKVLSVGVCGTDIHAYTGNQPFFSYPRVLGHELAGDIVKCGSKAANDFKIGERVALIPYVACHECPSCQSGKTNCCENISVIGVHQDGGFGEYLVAPKANVIKVGNVDPVTASLIEPFAISAHSVRRAQVQKGEDILVVGAGPIGLGAAAIAKADGANVVVADTQELRREKVRLNLDLPTINPMDEDFEEQLRSLFNGHLASTVIDATGNAFAMNNAVKHIRNGGKIVFVGLFKGKLEIDDPEFHKKETTIMGSRNATPEDFEKVCRLMQTGDITSQMMLTHKFNFYDIGDRYESDVVNNKELLKGVIIFD
ncbi:TPA: zinc-binding alcohol dehydrogenase family protein [Vibrio parahaemolyticus]|nr:zinc-binding alcohol dehydrogenase family protein [Vibrio parahaemolyticus]HCH3496604.1 zinc-binding alcohol dehydrogenase family protein [Vibrio parahaemolyticus]HCH5935712.1 zinc-binding alcohol dehydrogenase family protein [Vibrio parahaemolyticus]HCH5936585.1 zinc-binding alcohol dehydrogenase family protein [Vibrio parahaemolyticus]